MPHVVLLGDSVFDNAAYVDGGPDVVSQLRAILPAGWQASLFAVDGNVIADVPRQLAGRPRDTSHLVVSVGGNDALRAAAVLDQAARSVAEVLAVLADVRDRFRAEYVAMLDVVQATVRPAALCTIYDPRYSDPQRRRLTGAALALLNDVITREVFARGLPLIDLRVLCGEDADFANPIEPSVQGGRKIAQAVAALVQAHPEHPGSPVFAR
ncbi:GDSL-type esterase/lipase family protein [Methylobacterium sp. P31]